MERWAMRRRLHHYHGIPAVVSEMIIEDPTLDHSGSITYELDEPVEYLGGRLAQRLSVHVKPYATFRLTSSLNGTADLWIGPRYSGKWRHIGTDVGLRRFLITFNLLMGIAPDAYDDQGGSPEVGNMKLTRAQDDVFETRYIAELGSTTIAHSELVLLKAIKK